MNGIAAFSYFLPADSLDDRARHMAIAIYQLSELGLLLVEKSLENELAIKTM